MEKSIAAKIGPEKEERGGVANGLAMELHTEGVALRRGPFSHGKAERKAGREEGWLTVTGSAVLWIGLLVHMGDERGEGQG